MARDSRCRWTVRVIAAIMAVGSWWAFSASAASANLATRPPRLLTAAHRGQPLSTAMPTSTQVPAGWRYQGAASAGTVDPASARRAVASCAPGDLSGLPRIVYSSPSRLRDSAQGIYAGSTRDPVRGAPMAFVSLWGLKSVQDATAVMSSERRFEQRCSKVTFSASVGQQPAQPVTFVRSHLATPRLPGATDVLTVHTVSLSPDFQETAIVTMFRVGSVVAYVAAPPDVLVNLDRAVTRNLQPNI
jgi:hypothetical protein